ncbi:MAG: acetyl-CoA C-acyltransferase [Gammaproteobacteria bacterium]
MTAEAFICDYIRTPIGRYGGVLANLRADDLAAMPLAYLAKKHPWLSEEADEVIMGCANQAGEDNRNVARMALLLAGFAERVPGITVNRLCASGMDAVIMGARMIKSGEAELVVVGGSESMSRAPFVIPKATAAFSRQAEIYDTTIGWRFVHEQLRAQYGVESMPETAENVAAEFKVGRVAQDAFALRSQQKTAAAATLLAAEIMPITIAKTQTVVRTDEHPRPNTTAADLAKLPTPFRANGTVTAGNASGVNDGAAALIIASANAAAQHGLSPITRLVGGTSVGVAPRIMGIGAAAAGDKLCARLKTRPADFEVIELNEAFAAQAVAVLRAWDVAEDAPSVNPNGGAISLGHPLGMSGARIVGTAALTIQRRGGGRALAAMCVGVGQGAAVVLESV